MSQTTPTTENGELSTAADATKQDITVLVGVCFFLLYRIKIEEIFMNKSQSKQSRLYYLWKAEYRLLLQHDIYLILEMSDAFSTNRKKNDWIFVGSPRGGKSYSWEESSGFPTTLCRRLYENMHKRWYDINETVLIDFRDINETVLIDFIEKEFLNLS